MEEESLLQDDLTALVVRTHREPHALIIDANPLPLAWLWCANIHPGLRHSGIPASIQLFEGEAVCGRHRRVSQGDGGVPAIPQD
jgi:hypothetical protein